MVFRKSLHRVEHGIHQSAHPPMKYVTQTFLPKR
jgi:hypothetical protein